MRVRGRGPREKGLEGTNKQGIYFTRTQQQEVKPSLTHPFLHTDSLVHRRLKSCQSRVQYSRRYNRISKSVQKEKHHPIHFSYLLRLIVYLTIVSCLPSPPSYSPWRSFFTNKCTHTHPPSLPSISPTHVQLPYTLDSLSLSLTHINTQ